jgi:aerobic carbon-monoxide dehydrogenase small subunit
VTRVTADLAKASMAALMIRDGEKIVDCRMAFGSVAPKPIRIRDAEKIIKGKEYSPTLFSKAGDVVEISISPINDIRSTAIYRRRIVNVITQDTLGFLWESSKDLSKKAQPQTPPVKIASYKNSKHSLQISRDESKEIELIINGKKFKLYVAPNELLLNVLRDRLHLTGTKYGCGVGACSACTIHLDGKPTLSCLVLAIAANGKEVTTIEGLQQPSGELDPLQESFIENGAFQCGYCTPGILMTLKGLLKEIEKPDEDQIRDYLKGNRCRCTGYTSIVRAVMATLE